jgi:hypothetical protein
VAGNCRWPAENQPKGASPNFFYLPEPKIHNFNLEKHTPKNRRFFCCCCLFFGGGCKKRPVNLEVSWPVQEAKKVFSPTEKCEKKNVHFVFFLRVG